MRSRTVWEVSPSSSPLLGDVSEEAMSDRRAWSWATWASQASLQSRNFVVRQRGVIEGFYAGSDHVQICILAKLLW